MPDELEGFAPEPEVDLGLTPRPPRTSPVTVGATREFLARHYGVPHGDDTHYVIVASSVKDLTVGTCCDGVDEAAMLLADAAAQIGAARPAIARASASVIVSRSDLRAVLAAAFDLAGQSPEFHRLAQAAGIAR